MSFKSYIEYRKYQTIDHKWYSVNHSVVESINSL